MVIVLMIWEFFILSAITCPSGMVGQIIQRQELSHSGEIETTEEV